MLKKPMNIKKKMHNKEIKSIGKYHSIIICGLISIIILLLIVLASKKTEINNLNKDVERGNYSDLSYQLLALGGETEEDVILAKIEALENLATILTNQLNKKVAMLDVYPVGAIYTSISSANPSTLFGGTWVAWGSGRVPVGVDAGQSEFNTTDKIGGAKSHTLTIANLPSTAVIYYGTGNLSWGGPSGLSTNITNTYSTKYHSGQSSQVDSFSLLQPYITCYMWKRTG